MLNRFFYIALLLYLISFSLLISKEKNRRIIPIGFSKAMFQDVDTKDAVVAIQIWADELVKNQKLNIGFETKLYESNTEIIKAINNNEIELVTLPFLDYLNIKNEVNIYPKLVTSINQKPGIDFILVVKKESPYKKIEDLKKARINIPGGIYGKLVRLWLLNSTNGMTKSIDDFFSETKEVNKPSQGMLPVFFNQIDACVIPALSYNTLAELNPQLKNDLIIIDKSPVFLNEVMCTKNDFDPALLETIKGAAKEIGNSTKGRQILKLFKSDGIINFDIKYLEETQVFFKDFAKLKYME